MSAFEPAADVNMINKHVLQCESSNRNDSLSTDIRHPKLSHWNENFSDENLLPFKVIHVIAATNTQQLTFTASSEI